MKPPRRVRLRLARAWLWAVQPVDRVTGAAFDLAYPEDPQVTEPEPTPQWRAAADPVSPEEPVVTEHGPVDVAPEPGPVFTVTLVDGDGSERSKPGRYGETVSFSMPPLSKMLGYRVADAGGVVLWRDDEEREWFATGWFDVTIPDPTRGLNR